MPARRRKRGGTTSRGFPSVADVDRLALISAATSLVESPAESRADSSVPAIPVRLKTRYTTRATSASARLRRSTAVAAASDTTVRRR